MSDTRAQDPIARRFADALTEDEDTANATRDLRSEVMARLPQGSPALYRDIAALVVEAWGDPALRAALREAPEATLRDRGLRLPEGVSVTITPPEQASLPTAEGLALPLADATASEVGAQRSAAEALASLSRTEWRWLLLDPTSIAEQRSISRPISRAALEARSPARPRFDWRRWLALPRIAAPTWALAGAAGVVLLLLWSIVGLSPLGLGEVSGTAGGDLGAGRGLGAPSLMPWAVWAVGVAAVAALIWWNGRRGG